MSQPARTAAVASPDADYSSPDSDSDSDAQGVYGAGSGDAQLDEWSDRDEDEEEADEPSLCLFCDTRSNTLLETTKHMADKHAFDFRATSAALKLDFYSQMKLVNFLRAQRAASVQPEALVALLKATPRPAELAFLFDGSEGHLKPFMADDSLLFSLPRERGAGGDDDEDEDASAAAPSKASAAADASASTEAPSSLALMQENQSLRNELLAMQESVAAMQATLRRLAFSEEEEKSDAPALAASAASASPASAAAASSSQAVVKAKPASSSSAPGSFAPDHVDRDYFGGYSTRNIHELMLRDTIRTEAYRDFIYKAEGLFKGKVVLDVGCGTGILSMFAAKMGAARVIGVDAADIVHKAREIVQANGFSNVITIVHGKMEEVALPVDKVDIIISEWMGYFLLFESMLPSVLYARDRYLRAPPAKTQPIASATGVYPDRAIMYIAGIETSRATKERIHWWSDVYGFDMSCLVEERERFQSSTVEIIRPEQVVTSVALLKDIDCNYVRDEELDFAQEFELASTQEKEQLTAFMVYFDTLFALHCQTTINLSTAPMKDHAPQPELTTHWQQSVFYLAKPLDMQKNDRVKGKLTAKRMSPNPRAYDVLIEYVVVRDGKEGTKLIQEYKVQ